VYLNLVQFLHRVGAEQLTMVHLDEVTGKLDRTWEDIFGNDEPGLTLEHIKSFSLSSIHPRSSATGENARPLTGSSLNSIGPRHWVTGDDQSIIYLGDLGAGGYGSVYKARKPIRF